MTVASTPTAAALILSRTLCREVSPGPTTMEERGQMGLLVNELGLDRQVPTWMCTVFRARLAVPSAMGADTLVCPCARLLICTWYWPSSAPTLWAITVAGSLERAWSRDQVASWRSVCVASWCMDRAWRARATSDRRGGFSSGAR